MALLRDRRILLALLLITALGAFFWGGSRYPALNDKADMGGDTGLSGIGFDVLVELPPEASLWQRVIYTDINWMYTNWKGMTFGLLFAGAIMCLFSRLPSWRCANPFAGSLYGSLMGAPLGVCVNCATPIGRGLHEAGARPVVSLAATISSPTLNFVVLVMIFTLLPWYLAVLKLGLTLLFLLVLLPLIAGRLERPSVPRETADSPITEACANPGLSADTGWGAAAGWLTRAFPRNLWFIVRKTVPAMLLAGLLGSALITLIPVELISAIQLDDTLFMQLITLTFFAAFGLFLPVPMTFDVILTAVLLGAGLKPGYAMVLLFTLGAFSVYPFWVIGRSMSFRLAGTLAATLLAVGVSAGFAAHHWSNYRAARDLEFFIREMASGTETTPEWPLRGTRTGTARSLAEIRQLLSPQPSTELVHESPALSITRRSFRPSSPPAAGSTPFVSVSSAASGLDEAFALSPHKLISPFGEFRPLAAADIHQDGWEDLIVGADPVYGGFSIYANQSGERFVRQAADFPELEQAFVVNVMLADADNDSWPDLFVATYRRGLWFIRNDRGEFRRENLRAIPLPGDTVMIASMGFGDLDRDGDLDVALGRWSFGVHASDAIIGNGIDAPLSSGNLIGWNTAGQLDLTPLPGQPGETLTTLISDLDLDGWPDLFVGNDFDDPDLFYLGSPNRALRLIQHSEGRFPRTTGATMSITTVDTDNDLRWELYLAQIADQNRIATMDATEEWQQNAALPAARHHLELAGLLERSIRQRDPAQLREIADPQDRRVLLAAHMLRRMRATLQGDKDPLIAKWMNIMREHAPADLAFIATHPNAERRHASTSETREFHPQTPNNAFLTPGKAGYEDRAYDAGLGYADWAWNAQFADIDHDEDVDLYVANGVVFEHATRDANRFFRNEGNGRFTDQSLAYGLFDRDATSAYTWLDYDHDGDLDIISLPVDAPMRLYRNEAARGNSIAFAIRDEIGNRLGIGTRLVIHYGPRGERHQMREIRASGGFLSQDPPIAHFGLGKHEHIDRLEVHWSTGEHSEVNEKLTVGAQYTIERHEKLQTPEPKIQ